ncbi:hypothetical protein H4R34_004873 [Dimargaris verticillata]|uniref:Uncharacterized protein n=1 Tax=Dimargaris verticillata TaxID=2761393 RepID=A0A9W8E6R9_9FUNG|nr:hypothetical protein H4R34_004873 [Dimargaris verticillata]
MMASATATTLTPGDLLFNCVTDVHTQAEDLEADLQCLDVRISKERQSHQSILDAKNALIDALYFKACRLEFASKKAIGILQRVYRQALLANTPLDLAETENESLALPDKVTQAIAVALRYLEVGQVPIEDDLEQTADACLAGPHESILLNTYVSEDEAESEALVAPAPSAVASAKSTPKRGNPSHPPTPESLTQASLSPLPSVAATPLATPNLNATPSRSILRSAKPQDLSEWTPSSHGDNSPSPINLDQLPVTWEHDTPCKSAPTSENRPKPLRVSFDTTEPSVAYSPRSSIYSVASTLASPCQQCRKTEALFHTWQEERDTLRQGMENLAGQLEDTHGQLHHAELECLRLCQRLCSPHQSLRQFMLDQDLVHADGTPLTPTLSPKGPITTKDYMASLASPVPRSSPVPLSATSAASLHTLDALIDDFIQWVSVLHANRLAPTANSESHCGQSSLQSVMVSEVADDSHYSLLSTSTSASELTYSMSSVDTLTRSPTTADMSGSGNGYLPSNRMSCDSAIDPMGTHETLQSLVPLNVGATHKPQPMTQSDTPTALVASQPLDNPFAPSGQPGLSKANTCPVSPSRTVHLDAITYTDFANFTLGLATYGAKEALLPDPSMLMSANNPWNALPLAFQVMEDDIKPCLYIPSATHASSPWASPQAKQNARPVSALAADDLLTAILNQKCDIISGLRSPRGSSSIQPSPTTSEEGTEARETITLRGAAKRQVSLEGMPKLPTTNRARPMASSSAVPRSSSVSFVSQMAVCALCGQERECEYQLRIPIVHQHGSGATAQGPTRPGMPHGGYGGLFASSAMHHPSAPGSDQSRVSNALGPLAKGWKALTTDLKWGKRGKFGNGHTTACGVPTAKVHPAHVSSSMHSSYSGSSQVPPTAYHAHPIDRFCRDRIVTVCDLVGFLSHLSRGLWDHVPLINRYEKFVWHRQRINWARLGCLSILEPEELELEPNNSALLSQPHPPMAASSFTSCQLRPPPVGMFGTAMRASVATTTPAAEPGSMRAGAPFHLLPPRPMQPASTIYRGSMTGSATRPTDPMAQRQTRNRNLFVLRPQRSLPLMTAKRHAPVAGLPVPSHPLPTPSLPEPAQSAPPVNWKRSQLDDCQIVLVR